MFDWAEQPCYTASAAPRDEGAIPGTRVRQGTGLEADQARPGRLCIMGSVRARDTPASTVDPEARLSARRRLIAQQRQGTQDHLAVGIPRGQTLQLGW